MSSAVSVHSLAVKTTPLDSLRKKIASEEPTHIKPIDNPARIARARQLLYTDTRQEYVYDRVLLIPKSVPSNPSEAIATRLKFNFNVASLLDHCSSELEKAGFHVKERVFKGGAIHFLLDGYPATLRDFDVGLVIDPPKDPAAWQQINAIIFSCLEKEAGLTSFHYPDAPMISFTNNSRNISIEMPIRNGIKNLFEYGGLEMMWGWWFIPKLREKGEEYALYSIPAHPCRVELQVEASHENSATCSLDALRFHYEEESDEKEFSCWMTAVDGYDVHKALSLRRKRLFYCHSDRIPTLREGIYRYCSHLLKGFLPTDPGDETAFCKALFMSWNDLERFPANLTKYLKNHTSSPQDRIRYLLNLDAIFERYTEVSEARKLPLREFIAQLLLKELRIEKVTQKPEELVLEMQLMRDYLYLRTSMDSRFYHSYGARELCCLDDPRGREQGSFVIEPPKRESLKRCLSESVNTCIALQKLCDFFPHDKKDVYSFFCEKIEPKTEQREEKKASAPSIFSDFASFATYYQTNRDLPLKKCARCLQNLFSFKSESLKALSSEHTLLMKKVLSDIKVLLKKKEKSLVISVFKEAFRTGIFTPKERESETLELIPTLLMPFSQNDFKEALEICAKLIGNISFETLRTLINLLIATPANPKSVLELLEEIDSDVAKSGELVQIFDSILIRITEKVDFHPCLMTFWRIWNERITEESPSLIAIIDKFTKITSDILIKSKDEKVLCWAHEIAQVSSHPLLAKIKNRCEDFVAKGINDAGPSVVAFYMQQEHVLLKTEDQERFISTFSSFIQGLLSSKDHSDLHIDAAKRGIAHIIAKAFSSKIVLSKLGGAKIPSSLQRSFEELKKYAHQVKSDEKFSPHALSQLKKRFMENGDQALLDQGIDLLRILTKSSLPDLKPLYAEGLEFFVEGLKRAKQGDAKISRLLPILRNMLKDYKGWTTAEQKLLDEPLPKQEPKVDSGKHKKKKKEKKAESKVFYTSKGVPVMDARDFFEMDALDDIDKAAKKLDKEESRVKKGGKAALKLPYGYIKDALTETTKKIAQASSKPKKLEMLIKGFIEENESALLKNPAGNEQIWAELFCAYSLRAKGIRTFVLGYNINTIRCGEKLLPFISRPEEKATVHRLMGIAFANMGDPEEAIEFFKRSYNFKSDVSETVENLALTALYTQQWSVALSNMQILRASFGVEFSRIHQQIATLCKESKFKEAIPLLESITDTEMMVSRIYLIGSLYREIKDETRAIECFKKVLSYVPDHSTSLKQLESLEKTKKETGINIEANASPALAKKKILCNLLAACIDSKNSKKVIQYAEQLLLLPLPQDDLGFVNRHMGFAWSQLGDPEKALVFLQKSLGYDPKNIGTLSGLMINSFYAQQWTAVLEHIKDLRSTLTVSSLSKFEETTNLCLASKFKEAIQLLTNWPHDEMIANRHYLLACLFREIEDKENAIVSFNKVLTHIPEHPKTLLQLATLHKAADQ